MTDLDNRPDANPELVDAALRTRSVRDEDAVHDAFVRIASRTDSAMLADLPSYWRRAARNAAVDRHRQEQRQRSVLARWSSEQERYDLDFDESDLNDTRLSNLRAAVAQLSGRRRSLIEAELEGVRDSAVLAARLETTPGAIRVLRHRAYAELRRYMGTT